MSEYEFNKGTLVPVSVDRVKKKVKQHPEFGNFWDVEVADDLREAVYECLGDDFVELNGSWYALEDHVSNSNYDNICELVRCDDGSIGFVTHHYNGCAHWVELVESKLKENT